MSKMKCSVCYKKIKTTISSMRPNFSREIYIKYGIYMCRDCRFNVIKEKLMELVKNGIGRISKNK